MLPRVARVALSRLRHENTAGERAARVYARMSLQRDFLTTTLPRLAAGGWRQARCVFVPNTGRAGSMQLAEVLALSPEVIAQHEPSPMLLNLGAVAYQTGCAGLEWSTLIHGIRDDFVAFANHAGCLYAETNNRLTFLAPAIASAYPGSRFIHLHRHPLDFIKSGLGRRWYSGSGVDYSLITPRPDDPIAPRWSDMSQIEKIAWLWARTNGETGDFMASLAPERGFVLPAEDLFRADSRTISALFEFLGIPAPASAAVNRTLSKRMNAGKVTNRDRRFGASEQALVAPIVESVAVHLGYSL